MKSFDHICSYYGGICSYLAKPLCVGIPHAIMYSREVALVGPHILLACIGRLTECCARFLKFLADV